MALPITNISLNAIHIEVGGSTGTTVSLNDTDVRSLYGPDATYAGGDGINTTDQSTISIGEFRNGLNYISPTGTWITANTSQLTSSQWSVYFNNREQNPNNQTSIAQVGSNIIAKETSTHLELWVDADPTGDDADARLADDSTITEDVAYNPYKIWSYALPSGVSGFTVHYTDLTYLEQGSLSVPLTSASVSGYDLLQDGTAGSLSNDRAVNFYTTATSDPGDSYVYQQYRHNLSFEFNTTGYKIMPEFTLWYRAEARSFNSGCFDKNTLVQMADGTEKAIYLIQLGDITRGGEVFGTHTFLGGNNTYDYKGVILSGTHWVVENGRVMDVQDSKWAVKVDNPKYWYTLTTESHRIWVNDIEFYDEQCMEWDSMNKYAQALINNEKEEIEKWKDKSIELIT